MKTEKQRYPLLTLAYNHALAAIRQAAASFDEAFGPVPAGNNADPLFFHCNGDMPVYQSHSPYTKIQLKLKPDFVQIALSIALRHSPSPTSKSDLESLLGQRSVQTSGPKQNFSWSELRTFLELKANTRAIKCPETLVHKPSYKVDDELEYIGCMAVPEDGLDPDFKVESYGTSTFT